MAKRILRSSVYLFFGAIYSSALMADSDSSISITSDYSVQSNTLFRDDIANAARRQGVALSIKKSEGLVESVRSITSSDDVTIGIVQSDLLNFLGRSSDAELKNTADQLRLVFPLDDKDVHLFATKDISSISDLQGKRVVVGSEDSSNWLTANNMMQLMGVQPSESQTISPVKATMAVLLGKADAMFHVGTKPVEFFSNLQKLGENPKYKELLDNVHLVPVNDSKVLAEYTPTNFGSSDYPWLANDVPSVSVKTVLVGRDFTAQATPVYSASCDKLGEFTTAIRSDIDNIRASGHAGWGSVDLTQATGTWVQNACVTRKPETLEELVQDESFLTSITECLRTGDCPEPAEVTETESEVVASVEMETETDTINKPLDASEEVTANVEEKSTDTPVIAEPEEDGSNSQTLMNEEESQAPDNSETVAAIESTTQTATDVDVPSVTEGFVEACPFCPEMVTIPAGSFEMGSRIDGSERPVHPVKIDRSFAIAKYEVTVGTWKSCIADGACSELPKLEGASDEEPVRNVAWTDTQQFIEWLNNKTGSLYRLPTEAEWEYVARANSSSNYWWGDNMEAGKANCKECGGEYDRKNPNKVGQTEPNPLGVHDMNGGVWEWVADCWHQSYTGHPGDGSAWEEENCSQRVLRGGSWRNDASYARSSSRFFYDADVRYSANGFRVVVEQN